MVFWNRFKLLEGDEIMVDYGQEEGAVEEGPWV
jgi:hypothetical protein